MAESHGPYLDWDYLQKGDPVGFEKDGKIRIGIVEDIIEDEETGEVTIITK